MYRRVGFVALVCSLLVAVLLAFPSPLHALTALVLLQDASGPSTSFGLLVAAVLAPVIPWLAGKSYDGLKTIFPFFDRLPAIVHQVLAPLFGVASGWLTASFGVAAFTDLHGVTPGLIGGVYTALAMAGIKRWEKSKHPMDATIAVAASRESSTISPIR